jgi:hypothetical protein
MPVPIRTLFYGVDAHSASPMLFYKFALGFTQVVEFAAFYGILFLAHDGDSLYLVWPLPTFYNMRSS